MISNIIDISTYQKSIDFNKIKEAGIEGVVIRCGFGWDRPTQKDNRFEQHYAGAKAAGLKVGAYHFSYADNVYAAEREAYTCLEYIKDKQFELPIFYDICDTGSPQCNASKQLVTDEACKFCEILENNGYYVGIYCGCAYAKNKLDYERIKRYTLWIAQYYTECQYPYNFDMWQYTSSGSVNGYSGRLDMNYCYKDYGSEISSRGGNPVTEQKEDENVIADLQAQITELKTTVSNANTEIQHLNNLVKDITAQKENSEQSLALLKEDFSEVLAEKKAFASQLATVNKALEEATKKLEAGVLAGDFNGDGKVNTLDALDILKHCAGF